MSERVRLKVLRRDCPEDRPRWESFEVDREPLMSVVSCLEAIQRDPVTTEGVAVAPVAWESSCLEEMCGSCSMIINGRVGQACAARVDDLEQPIELRPLSTFPVIRDLVVDRSVMFEALKEVRAWIDIDGTHDLGFAPRQSPDHQEVRDALSRCMVCGCCVEACPSVNARSSFIGPQAISQVRFLNAHPSGKLQARRRLEAVMGPGGIAWCGKSGNCAEVCPREIPLTESLSAVNRDTVKHMLTRWLRR